MKKQILNLGNALNKNEQKEVLGGFKPPILDCVYSSYESCKFHCGSNGDCVLSDPPPYGSGCWTCDLSHVL